MPTKQELTTQLQEILNELVDDKLNEIDAVFVQEMESGFVHHSSTTTEGRDSLLVDATKGGATASFGHLRNVREAIDRFGKDINRGQLQYVTFQLTDGIVQVYFEDFKGKTFGIVFVSKTPQGVQALVYYSSGSIDGIKEKLAGLL